MLIDSVIDFTLYSIVYFVCFKSIDYVLNDCSDLLKDMFGIQVRYNAYSREIDRETRYSILHHISCIPLIILMSISPIITTIVYGVFFLMVDIVQFNKLLLLIVFIKMVNSGLQKKISIVTFSQLLYTIINYDNPNIVLHIIFQIIDELFSIFDVIKTYDLIYKLIFVEELFFKEKLVEIIAFSKSKERLIVKSQFRFMGLIYIIMILLDTKKYDVNTLIFYYYALTRLYIINDTFKLI